jgi:hypothetical protein
MRRRRQKRALPGYPRRRSSYEGTAASSIQFDEETIPMSFVLKGLELSGMPLEVY